MSSFLPSVIMTTRQRDAQGLLAEIGPVVSVCTARVYFNY